MLTSDVPLNSSEGYLKTNDADNEPIEVGKSRQKCREHPPKQSYLKDHYNHDCFSDRHAVSSSSLAPPVAGKHEDDAATQSFSTDPSEGNEDIDYSSSFSDPEEIQGSKKNKKKYDKTPQSSQASSLLLKPKHQPQCFRVSTIIESDAIEMKRVSVSPPLTQSRKTLSGASVVRHTSKASSRSSNSRTNINPKKKSHGNKDERQQYMKEHQRVPGSSAFKRRGGQDEKTVQFNLQEMEYYENDRSLSDPQEWQDCWFTPEELKAFKLQQTEIVKVLFSKQPPPPDTIGVIGAASREPGLSSEKNEENSPPALAPSGSFSFGVSNDRNKNSGPAKRAPLRRRIANLLRPLRTTKRSSSNNTSSRQELDVIGEAHDTSQRALDWRDSIDLLYQECRKVRRNQMIGQLDREAFQKLYEENPELVGLEVYVLFALRGSVSSQVRKILEYYQESLRNPNDFDDDDDEEIRSFLGLPDSISLGTRSYSGVSYDARSRSSIGQRSSSWIPGDSDNGVNEDEDEERNKELQRQRQKIFVKNVQQFTLPVKFFVHELALAQAAALEAQELKDEQEEEFLQEENKEDDVGIEI